MKDKPAPNLFALHDAETAGNKAIPAAIICDCVRLKSVSVLKDILPKQDKHKFYKTPQVEIESCHQL
jgi:hypothetical protein